MMGLRKVTISIMQQLNKCYDAGANELEIAAQFGLSQPTVSKYIWKPRKATGGRNQDHRVTKEEIMEINRLYDDGYNMKMVADKMGISNSSVCSYVWNPRRSGTKTEIKII